MVVRTFGAALGHVVSSQLGPHANRPQIHLQHLLPGLVVLVQKPPCMSALVASAAACHRPHMSLLPAALSMSNGRFLLLSFCHQCLHVSAPLEQC